jgi:hypothetical protein
VIIETSFFLILVYYNLVFPSVLWLRYILNCNSVCYEYFVSFFFLLYLSCFMTCGHGLWQIRAFWFPSPLWELKFWWFENPLRSNFWGFWKTKVMKKINSSIYLQI